MKKLLVVLFLMLTLVVVGCNKGASGFDKPEDLGAKIVSLKDTMKKGNFGVIVDLVYFDKAEDKAKVKSYFSLMEEAMKEMMKDMKEDPKEEDKFTFKEAKVEGTKGELLFNDGSNMKIVQVDGKWYLSSEESMIQEALKADLEATKKQIEDRKKEMEEAKKNMPKEEPKN